MLTRLAMDANGMAVYHVTPAAPRLDQRPLGSLACAFNAFSIAHSAALRPLVASLCGLVELGLR